MEQSISQNVHFYNSINVTKRILVLKTKCYKKDGWVTKRIFVYRNVTKRIFGLQKGCFFKAVMLQKG